MSHGIDLETIQAFRDHLDENIDKISRKLKAHEYAFAPLRAKQISKEGGGIRILRIPAVRDRVVLTALKILIAHRFAQFNRPCSHGYIRKRSRFTAIAAIRELVAHGHYWVLEADIKKFFDEVPRPILKEKFVRQIRVPSITSFVEQAIDMEVGNRDEFQTSEMAFLFTDSGIPQGGVLSPMLANFYLHEFDLAMERGGFNLVRYADDFVVLSSSEAEAHRAYKLCLEVLETRLGLKIHHLGEPSKKTSIFHFSRGFTFLGIEFRGDKLIPAPKAVERFKARINDILRTEGDNTVLRALVALRNTVLGWGDSFRQYDSTETFQKMDEYIREALTLYLRGRSFVGSNISLSNKDVRFIGIPSLQRFKQRPQRPSQSTQAITSG
ncbi:MAG: reverse transcriptase domain-containing protein [Candidatus Acidiferrales bacterium]